MTSTPPISNITALIADIPDHTHSIFVCGCVVIETPPIKMANLPVDDLPSEFDAIIEGTGMYIISDTLFPVVSDVGCIQCIVAGALSRVGKRVLHLDR